MSETSACFGWLIPIGQDGKDVALFPLKRQLYVIGRYAQDGCLKRSNGLNFCSYRAKRWIRAAIQISLWFSLLCPHSNVCLPNTYSTSMWKLHFSAEQVNIRLPYKGIHPFHATVIVDSQGCVRRFPLSFA